MIVILAVATLVLGACGSDSDDDVTASGPSTTPTTTSAPTSEPVDDGDDQAAPATEIEIVMTEFAYDPDRIEVPVGEPVRLVFTNIGGIEHEAMIGTEHQQEEFAEMGGHESGHMNDGGHHDEMRALTVAAGESGSLDVTFDEPGELVIGCHLPGHWDAGMRAALVVTG